MQTEMSHLYDSDDNESDGSLISYNSSLQNVPSSLSGFGKFKILGLFINTPGEWTIMGKFNLLNLLERPKKRGRPKKIDLDTGRSGTPVMNGRQPITHAEALKVTDKPANIIF